MIDYTVTFVVVKGGDLETGTLGVSTERGRVNTEEEKIARMSLSRLNLGESDKVYRKESIETVEKASFVPADWTEIKA